MTRPLLQSGILEFGEWMGQEDWLEISGKTDPSEQVLIFENIVKQKLDVIFPTKTDLLNESIGST